MLETNSTNKRNAEKMSSIPRLSAIPKAAIQAPTTATKVSHLSNYFKGRVSPLHLNCRLGMEREREVWVRSAWNRFFHIENWYSVHNLIRSALKLSLLYERAKRNAMDIRLRRHDIPIVGLPARFDGYTILQLSDLHMDMNPAFASVLATRLEGLNYDICVFSGDYRYLTFGDIEPALRGLEHVCAKLRQPCYGILGNHDSITMVPALEAMGIKMLMNETTCLERQGEMIYLAGIDDAHFYRLDNLEKASHGINQEQAVSILLTHTPEVYKQAAHIGFNVMLCGHTHGGQICLPGGLPLLWDADCPRRIVRGAWRYQNLQGYTSVGAGASIVDVRLNCPPEITMHRLLKA